MRDLPSGVTTQREHQSTADVLARARERVAQQ
jgi:hypothetical protein